MVHLCLLAVSAICGNVFFADRVGTIVFPFTITTLKACLCAVMIPTASLLLRKYHGGYVVIRLALGGATNRPFYRIVATYNKRARDGKYIEQLGSYDPLPNIFNEKLVSFNSDRIKYWMGCGAHPTKPVAKLLGLAGFFPLHPMTITEAERRWRKSALKEEATTENEDQEAKQAEQ